MANVSSFKMFGQIPPFSFNLLFGGFQHAVDSFTEPLVNFNRYYCIDKNIENG
jgi:hypothetical protein